MNEAHLLSLTSNIGVKQNTVYVKDSQCLGILFEFLFIPSSFQFLFKETLQDLIRFLRRDSASERYVMLQLSAWNIMNKDLIPLILTYSQNQNLVYHAGELKNIMCSCSHLLYK